MNRFRQGRDQVTLHESSVPKEWRDKGDFGRTLQFMNDAFRVYWRGWQVINSVDVNHADGELMRRALHEAAASGYGPGGDWTSRWSEPDDLHEALDYLHGRWTRNEVPWWGHSDRVQTSIPGIKAPKAVKNFMDAVESQFAQMIRAQEAFQSELHFLRDTSDWQTISRRVSSISSKATHVKRFMWLAPSKLTPKPVKGMVSGAIGISDAFNKIHSGATLLAQVWNDDENAAFDAMRLAVSHLPVLGQFFGEALSSIPSLREKMTRIRSAHEFRLDMAAQGVIVR